MRVSEDGPVLITGAGGLIGSELVASASQWFPESEVRGIGRSDLDLADPAAVRKFFMQTRPGAVIHCAAVSKSPVCDANRELAWQANVEAPRFLTEAAGEVPFVFFSSDLVFDGTKGEYLEEDAPNPLMFYGETKAAAETIVRKHPNHLIVRISLTGGHSRTGDRGFNEEMKNAWRAGRRLNLFTDEYRCPMAAEVAARAVWELLRRGAPGTYHLCGGEKVSRHQIGRLLAERHPELNPRIVAGSRKDYQGPPRPADTSLNTAKIQRLLSFPLPRFSDWLRADGSGF